MNEDDSYLIVLAYLEDTRKWTVETLQSAIISVIDLVNTASDLTGIYAVEGSTDQLYAIDLRTGVAASTGCR